MSYLFAHVTDETRKFAWGPISNSSTLPAVAIVAAPSEKPGGTHAKMFPKLWAAYEIARWSICS